MNGVGLKQCAAQDPLRQLPDLAFLNRKAPHPAPSLDTPLLKCIGAKRQVSRIKDLGIHKCLDFVARNYSAPIQVRDLAKASGMSTQRLTYVFDQTLGIPPGAVLRSVRLEQAKRLLVEEDLKLNEIARQCGYRNQNSLCIAFQRAVGVSPKKFQRQYWLSLCRGQKPNS